MAVIETEENAKDLILQSHYYKTSYENIKKTYLELLEELKHTVVSVNDEFVEIYSEIPHFTVVAKIIEQNPLETSIDLYINSEYLVGNKSKAEKFLSTVYKRLEENYEFKGVSLHKEK